MSQRYWVGVTDGDWFDYLRVRAPDELNFWQPSAERRAVRLDAGALFLFKLHAPRNFVVGGGVYVRYSALPARLAWDAFGEKNGAPSYAVLRERVERYRKKPIQGDPFIGCNILNSPFFFEHKDWLPIPETWARRYPEAVLRLTPTWFTHESTTRSRLRFSACSPISC